MDYQNLRQLSDEFEVKINKETGIANVTGIVAGIGYRVLFSVDTEGLFGFEIHDEDIEKCLLKLTEKPATLEQLEGEPV